MEDRQTILVVDDDQEIIDILKEHFKERNCETVATQDPETVVDTLKNISVKLMLLDIKMRRLDGFDVLDKIKEAGLELPPTIIITGFLPKYIDRLNTYGIEKNDVVEKPFDFDVMEDRINQKLGAQVMASEVGSEYEDQLYKKNKCRLGIVEDEDDLIMYFKEFFGDRNYQIDCYQNGTEAYEALKKKPVDILFVDIKLPGMQGDELIEKLKNEPTAPYFIPISADPLLPDMENKLKEFGCHPYIAKPLDIIELIEIVKTVAMKKGLIG